MKRSVLAALALLLVLCCGADEFGSFQVVNPSGVASPEYQEYTWLFRMAGADPTHSDYATWAAAADSIITLSEDNFAYDELREAYPYDSITGQRFVISWQTGTRGQLPNPDTANDSWSMFWIPFESYLPAGSWIRQALMGVRAYAGTTTAAGDSIWAVADTLSGDRYWITGNKTGRTADPVLFGRRSASYYNQRQNAHSAGSIVTTANGFCAACDSHRWSPTIAARTRTIDWGPRSLGYAFTGTTADSASLSIDITRSVQYIVSGAQNSGIWLILKSTGAGARNLAWTTPAAATTRYTQKPFWVVKWSECQPPHVYPGGKEVAFTFVSDDGLIDANKAWADVYADLGLSYTIAISQAHHAASNRWTWASVLNWYNAGMEIAGHSRRHKTNGLCAWDSSAAEQESLRVDLDPGWLYAGLDSASATRDSASWAGDRRVGKTLALPQQKYNQRVLAIADSLGYLCVRGDGPGGLAYSSLPGDTLGVPGATGTGRIFGISAPRKCNAFLVPYMWTSASIFGTPGGTKATEGQVRRSVKLCIEDAAVRHRNGWWLMYVHSLFSAPESYTAGIDADQMGWLLDELLDSGIVWIANMGEVRRFWLRNGTEYAHPTPWGTDDAWENRLGGANGPERLLWYKSRFQ